MCRGSSVVILNEVKDPSYIVILSGAKNPVKNTAKLISGSFARAIRPLRMMFPRFSCLDCFSNRQGIFNIANVEQALISSADRHTGVCLSLVVEPLLLEVLILRFP